MAANDGVSFVRYRPSGEVGIDRHPAVGAGAHDVRQIEVAVGQGPGHVVAKLANNGDNESEQVIGCG